jgi:hypothetical protein
MGRIGSTAIGSGSGVVVSRRPPPLLWAAWGLALLGGLALCIGLVLALGDPCIDPAAGPILSTCQGVPGEVAALALGGTSLAVVGGGIAATVALRGNRDRDRNHDRKH